MRPHRLAIEAFGPYADPLQISFDDLSEEGLFLIHGSTGAGKTFLLDAVCFALYGEVPGDRSVRSLRSDHAAATAVPRVSLEFSSAGGRWRVERSPAHTAPRARGGGTTEKAAQAALFRLRGGAAEPVAGRISEVNREVEQLLGLTAAQFQQVILLPQGRFAEVLRARAEDREALLKTLFHTVLYEQAGQWLDDQARAARQRLDEQERLLAGLRAQAAGRWPPFAASVPADQAALDGLVAAITQVVDDADRQLQQATARLQQARQEAEGRQRLADRWDRRAAARERLAQLDGQQAVVDDHRRRLRLADQAEALRASVEAETEARQELERQQRASGLQLQEARQVRSAALALPVSLQQLDLTTLPAAEVLADARHDLAARRAEVAALADRAREAEERHTAAAAAARLATEAAAVLARDTTALAEVQQQQRATQAALDQARSAHDRLEGLQQLASEARAQATAAAALTAALAAERQAQAAADRAERHLQQATMTLQRLRQRQIAGMAARLAADLQPGVPCPVCGGVDHPAPAHPAADAVADADLQAAETALQTATSTARQAATALATATAEQRALHDKAGDSAADPAAAAAVAEAALAEARKAAAAREPLQQTLAAQGRTVEALQASLQAATTEQALQRQAETAARQQAQALAAAIAADLGASLEPAMVLRSLPPLETALRTLAATVEARGRARSRLDQAAARLARDLQGSPFADGAAVEAALAKEDWRRKVLERIEAWDRERTEKRGELAAADLADLPEARPDTAVAAEAATAADGQRTAAVAHHSEARSAATAITELSNQHRAGSDVRAEAHGQAQRLSAVADRCTGRAAPYISLQRWVLAAYLDEICRHANQRLGQMTSGRYRLQLSDEGGRGGRQAGLSLRVLDAFTGEEREVNSLSGGETFQASLALALGVADTVQAHAGGVQLEALFIDEGFGSLDPDSLQLAMDELDRLRAGGRLIGVISHVAALRERIRAGITVTAGPRGSTATVGRNTWT